MRLRNLSFTILLICSGYAFMLPPEKVTLFLIGDSTMADKPLEGVHLHILLVWQKQHGTWQLVARQAVKKV